MLRTRHTDTTIDLSQIAKMFGGGGHPRAARFTWKDSIEKLWKEMETRLPKKVNKKRSHKKTLKK
jgi:nanoRNase/pAp phosphatase (c-di-AMP/oligoRNAs hydrolase)